MRHTTNLGYTFTCTCDFTTFFLFTWALIPENTSTLQKNNNQLIAYGTVWHVSECVVVVITLVII